MNGLASLLRYQMGGPVGYVDGGQIDSIYNTLFGRSADEGGKAYYEALLKDRSVADAIAIIGGGATGEDVDVNEDLRQKIADETIKAAYENVLGRPEDVAGLQFYQEQVLNQGLDPTQIDDIFADSPEAQVRKDAEEFLRRLEAGEDVTGIGTPLDTSQFTAPITPSIAADLITRSQTVGVPNSEFDQYGGYDAVKNVYDASGGAGPGVVTDDTVVDGVETIDLPTRTTPPNVDTTNLFTSTGDTRAVTGPPVSDYGYINDLYKTYLGRDASAQELASYAGIFGPTIEPNEIKDFILGGVTSKEISQEQANDLLKTLPTPTPGSNQILGIPTFARQTPSDLTFAPLRRGLAQLRPAMSMPGLTSGQAAFGGVAPTPVQPSGNVVSPLPATPYALPEDFALQTGAYGEPTPTFLARPEKAAEPFPTDPKPLTDFTQNPIIGYTEDKTPIYSPNPASQESSARAGGMIKMAEGGEPPTPPPMSKLSPSELGSTFDIADYIDDQGRLVGGYSKPIYDENRVITGYEYRPYESNVVFNPRLREREAMGVSPEEQEMALRAMIARQGLTGVNPMTGGLPGIMAREAVMRRRPDYNFAEGGNVSSTAQDLASRGRGGDSMLVHMAPHEVAGLNAIARMQGTELTINPETGMPEALKLGKLFKTLAPFIPFIPGVGQLLAPIVGPGLAAFGAANPLLTKAIASGVIGGFTGPKGGFDLQRGLMQGITAYGMGSLMQNLGPATPTGTPAGTAVSPEMGGVDLTGADAGFNIAEQATQQPFAIGADAGFNIAESANVMEGGLPPTSPTFDSGSMRPVSQNLPYGQKGIPGLDPNVAAPPAPSGFGEPMKTPTALLTTGLGLSSTADYDKLTSAGIAVKREKEEEDELYRRLFERSLGAVPVRSGGLMKLAGGGMSYMEAGGTTGPTGAPREVVGNGDGMSDSVPADIEGVQEARLADGEFVIPADVVADIGNGSSDAGSKKLYDMMDRVRMARHDTTEQPPEIKAERLMPA
jgi:hypothetical protein